MSPVVQAHADQLAGFVHHVGENRRFDKRQALVPGDTGKLLPAFSPDHRVHVPGKTGGRGVHHAPGRVYGEMYLPICDDITKLH